LAQRNIQNKRLRKGKERKGKGGGTDQMKTIVIPITSTKAANADISLPGGVKLYQLGLAFKFVGSDGTAAAAHSALTVDSKGNGNASGAGAIKLQASGAVVRCGDALDTKASLVLIGVAPGEVQGFGEA